MRNSIHVRGFGWADLAAVMSDQSSTSLDKSERVVAAKRVTFTSSRPYNQAVSSLNFELNASKAGFNLLRLLATATTRKELVNGINEMADGRDFMYVQRSYRKISR